MYFAVTTGRVAVPPEPNPLLLGRGPLGPRADSAGPPPDRLAARCDELCTARGDTLAIPARLDIYNWLIPGSARDGGTQ